MPYDDEPGSGRTPEDFGHPVRIGRDSADHHDLDHVGVEHETEIVARVSPPAEPPPDPAMPTGDAVPEDASALVLLDRAWARTTAAVLAAWAHLRPALSRAATFLRVALAKAWRAAPAGLAVVLPLAFVSGLLVGPAIAAPGAAPSSPTSAPPAAVAGLSDGASADAAVQPAKARRAARAERAARNAENTPAVQDAAVALTPSDGAVASTTDDIGVDPAQADRPVTTTATTKTTGSTKARAGFDPASPGLVYRYPTLTGQTVSPPDRLTAKIARTLPLPEHSGKGRRIVYSASEQHLWIVAASGAVVRDYPVTGRVDRPGPGTYAVYSKSEASYNPIAKVTFTHMVRFAYGVTGASIGFHSIPKWANGRPLQTDASLGLALGRGGCIRQTMDNATFLYDWAHLGDTVVVTA